LTFITVSHTLIVVHRVLALLLITALIATSAMEPLLHTHVYTDHDHPEHHHGLAAHQHELEPAHPDDATTGVEACDAGEHAVSFASVCAAVPQVPVFLVEVGAPALPVPDLPNWQPLGYTDVRVHGPPPRSTAPPRAPPLIAHA
jgi:hypothetical protein